MTHPKTPQNAPKKQKNSIRVKSLTPVRELDLRSVIVDDAVFSLPEMRSKLVEHSDFVQKRDASSTLTELLHEGVGVPFSAVLNDEFHEQIPTQVGLFRKLICWSKRHDHSFLCDH